LASRYILLPLIFPHQTVEAAIGAEVSDRITVEGVDRRFVVARIVGQQSCQGDRLLAPGIAFCSPNRDGNQCERDRRGDRDDLAIAALYCRRPGTNGVASECERREEWSETEQANPGVQRPEDA